MRLKPTIMAFFWISNRVLSFQSTESSDRIITVFHGANLFFVSPSHRRNSHLKVMSLSPSHKLQSRTETGRQGILISHIQLSLQSYTICYTTEKFRIVSSTGPRHVLKFYYNNSCHIFSCERNSTIPWCGVCES